MRTYTEYYENLDALVNHFVNDVYDTRTYDNLTGMIWIFPPCVRDKEKGLAQIEKWRRTCGIKENQPFTLSITPYESMSGGTGYRCKLKYKNFKQLTLF